MEYFEAASFTSMIDPISALGGERRDIARVASPPTVGRALGEATSAALRRMERAGFTCSP